MSTSITSRARALLPPIALPRPRLTVVPRAATTPRRLPFVLLVVALLGTGLVGLLLLNTSMERGAYRVTALRSTAAVLTARQQQLQLQVAALGDPRELATKAARLGMVQNPSPAFLSLRTGAVVGHSVAGAATDRLPIRTAVPIDRGQLGKIAPPVAGAGNGAGSAGFEHLAPTPPKKAGATKGGDTGGTSPARQ